MSFSIQAGRPAVRTCESAADMADAAGGDVLLRGRGRPLSPGTGCRSGCRTVRPQRPLNELGDLLATAPQGFVRTGKAGGR